QRAGQQLRLAQDLESVADAEHRQAGPGGGHQLGHHPREPGDSAAAQVVAIGEAAGQHHGIDAPQVAVTMPERDRDGARPADGPGGIVVIERARKRDDPDACSTHEHTTTQADYRPRAGDAPTARSGFMIPADSCSMCWQPSGIMEWLSPAQPASLSVSMPGTGSAPFSG